jgi:hypothetical protein
METTDNTRDNARGNGREPRLPVDAPSLDLAKYRDLAGDVEISDEEFDEFLRTLWSIMNGFVQNAWDVKTIPAFLPELFEDASDEGADAVDSRDDEDADDEA